MHITIRPKLRALLSNYFRKKLTSRKGNQTRLKAFFVWMRRLVADPFPLTLSLSHKGRGNPRTISSYKCKPLQPPTAGDTGLPLGFSVSRVKHHERVFHHPYPFW